MPYLTERLFALAMTAVDVSAIGRSNVERPTLDVQSKRAVGACALFGAPLLVTRDSQTHSNGVDEIVAY